MHTKTAQFLFFAIAAIVCLPASAGTYWVSPSGTAPWSQAQSGAPLSGISCASLQTANANAAARDTVFLREGAYSAIGYINPTHSGTSENSRILYCNYNNDSVTVRDESYGIYLYKKSFITVNGIHFENLNRFMRIYAGHYNTVGYCTFNQRKSTSGDWAGGLIGDDYNDTTPASENSTYNLVHHCTFSRFIYGAYAEYRGSLLDIGNSENAGDESYYNRVEDNVFFYGGHHTLGIFSRYNIIRGNYFHNESWDWEGYRDVITQGSWGGWSLYENNRFAFAYKASGLSLRTHHNILRRNMFYANGLGGIQVVRSAAVDLADSNHIYHNDFYNNGQDADYAGFSGGLYFCDWGNGDPIGNAVKNNIFFDNKGGAITTDAVSTPQILAGNWDRGDPLFTDDESPIGPFIPGLPDFHLQVSSPCIDSGTALTRITSAGGIGKSFTVEDAAYFMNGWGIKGIAGDEIQLLGSAQRARITVVDYPANSITVDSTITWSQNQGVCLAYNGNAPDIGAYEYGMGNRVIRALRESRPVKCPNACAIYNIQGRKICALSMTASGLGITARNFHNGVYIIAAGPGKLMRVKKITVMK